MSGLISSRRFDFSIPQAQTLSDLSGVAQDLEAVLRICKRVARIAEEIHTLVHTYPIEWLDERAAISDLLEAAVIRYGRTFGLGVRRGIPKEWFDELPPEMKKVHTYFKAMRDKFIAHAVNPLDDNQVWVWVQGEGAQALVKRISVDPGRFMLGDDGAKELHDLASVLLERITGKIKIEEAAVLKIAQSIPISELTSRSQDELPIPSLKLAAADRKRFKA